MYHDRLLREGKGLEYGICGVGVMPQDWAMRDALAAQDHLYTLVVKHADGTYEPRVIGSIVDYRFAPDDEKAVIEQLAAETTRIVSLTVTEGDYEIGNVVFRHRPGGERRRALRARLHGPRGNTDAGRRPRRRPRRLQGDADRAPLQSRGP